ncbi:MAG: glycosyltransferase family 4 protein [Frankiaceae bacterium]|jgi:phosphatidylinositol alpha-1,6-mannosyltransferase|nr:glycosyltransferase family 4 protein [Frankiaceae bacterium]
MIAGDPPPAPEAGGPDGPPAFRRTLIVTNDFPPRSGGIQTFVWECALRQPPGSVVVYASRSPGWERFDQQAPFPVIRDRSSLLLPTPRVARAAAAALREHGCTSVWFGAAAPLGLLGGALRRAGATRIVATAHGHELGWARLPGARQLLGLIGRRVDVVTVLGQHTGRALRRALRADSAAGPAIARLAPGVDAERFAGARERGAALRARLGWGAGTPVIVCVSRLVPRKGQDALIRAMPAVRRSIPGAQLAIIGRGRDAARLRRLAARHVPGAVLFAGAAPDDELPGWYGAGDVFAMPCRTRRGGLDVEGLGIVYLEASAAGSPVVAGRSGGAPEAVRDQITGVVVDGRSVRAVSAAIIRLLADRERAEAMGRAGRRWVERDWTWARSGARLRELLDS